MTDVKIFNSPQFGELRTARNEKGEMLFCLKDVCNSLGLQVGATAKRLGFDTLVQLRYQDKESCTPGTIGVSTEIISHGTATGQYKEIQMRFVTEPDLYRCIFQSRKPTARKFQDWVFNEVLPSLRKDGAYVVAKQEDTEEDIIARGLIAARAALARKEQRLRELESENAQSRQVINVQQEELSKAAPKVEYYDNTLNSKDCMTSSQVALDLGITAQELHKKLCKAGIIYKQSGQWNLHRPYKGWKLHDTNTYTFPSGNGGTHTNVYTVWTQRGRRFIHALFNNNFNVKLAIAEINGNTTK